MNQSTRLIIGQYHPGNSLLHRTHPVLKIALLFIYCLLIFQLPAILQLLCITPFLYLAFYSINISLRFLLKGLKPLLFLLLFTFFIHVLCTPGETLTEFLGIAISKEGLQKGIFYTLRLLLVITGSSLLTFSTSSIEITYALDRLLSPFEKLGFPSKEFSLMLAVSLRFIPVLMEEMEKLMMAQTARGASFTKGPLSHRVKTFSSLLIPLFHSAFERADQLAIAMEIRGFDPDKPRTSIHEYNFTGADLILGLGFATLFAAIFQFVPPIF